MSAADAPAPTTWEHCGHTVTVAPDAGAWEEYPATRGYAAGRRWVGQWVVTVDGERIHAGPDPVPLCDIGRRTAGLTAARLGTVWSENGARWQIDRRGKARQVAP